MSPCRAVFRNSGRYPESEFGEFVSRARLHTLFSMWVVTAGEKGDGVERGGHFRQTAVMNAQLSHRQRRFLTDLGSPDNGLYCRGLRTLPQAGLGYQKELP